MEIIERYIYAIKRRLPGKMSDDIATEIESLLYDELEEKFGNKETYTKDEIEEVMIEMGHPREVAERYRGGKQYLIGPEIFPIYKMVASIVLGAVTLGLVISFVISAFTMEANTAWDSIKPFFGFFPSLFAAWMSAIGGLTITFAIIEHFAKLDGKEFDFSEGWKPSDLPELPEEKDIVRLWEPIVSMVFIIIWLILLNSYIYTQGAILESLEHVTFLPVLNFEALQQFLPVWNLSIGLSLALQIVYIVTRKHTLFTRIFEIVLSLFGIVILVMILNGPALVDFTQIVDFFQNSNLTMASLDANYRLGIKILIGLSTFGMIVNIIKLIVQQARKANV
jgi:hypothetical protein